MFFFFSSRRRHTRFDCDWSSDVCSSDLVTRETIDGVIAKARLGVGAVAAIPVSDTVKDVEQERITKTVPRNRLWRAQTPQGFPRAMIERAYAGLANGDAASTDDAELCERAGFPVEVV